MGLWGIAFVIFFIDFCILAISGKEFSRLIIPIVGFLLIGLYLIFTAYLMIRKFSERAIKHFCAIIAVLFGGGLIQIFHTYQSRPFETQTKFIFFLLPLLAIILLYAIGQKILIRLTIKKSNS